MEFFKAMRTSNEIPLPPLEECSIELTRIANDPNEYSSKRVIKRIFLWPKKYIKKIYNSYLLIRYAELREPAAKNICPMRWINQFSTLFFDMKIVSKPNLMKAILRQPRKDPVNGIFDDRENAQVFLPLLRDLYPSEEISCEDFLLTCSKGYINYYRQPILRFIGPNNIKNHQFELQKIVEETLSHLEEAAPINSMEFSFTFTTHVISRLLLGHPGPVSTYKEIAYAIDYLNKYVMKRTWRQRISKSEKKKYLAALDVVRKAIETSLTSLEKPVLGSLIDTLREEKKMTELQIKTTLLLMYLGGSETAASLLNYLLWQLGQHLDYQEKIFQELKQGTGTLFEKANNSLCIDRLFNESIRLFTPAYVMGRQPAADLVCRVKNKQGELIFSEKIDKKEGLLCGATFAARDPLQFEKPDQFNPYRFQDSLKTLSWLPFGDGKHSCPGQWLAKNEVILFVAGLVQKYQVRSYPPKEIGQKGYMTLKPAEEVSLRLIPRKH